MKYLGIDYGSKRIGVAVSDESATIAFPLGTIKAGKGALQEILSIARENEVKIAVIGESRNFAQEKNPIMKEVEEFAEKLQAENIAVVFEPEFMTSAQAIRLEGKNSKPIQRASTKTLAAQLDASAAALILQSYLDRLRNSR